MPLTGNQITIGRRRHSTGDTPDIDLSVPPEDPGVSHQHAVLVQQPDGSWAVVDQNSTNGTTVNGGEDPIQPFVPIPLRTATGSTWAPGPRSRSAGADRAGSQRQGRQRPSPVTRVR